MANEAGMCKKTGQLKKCDETKPRVGQPDAGQRRLFSGT
jgi:hypothetical protein